MTDEEWGKWSNREIARQCHVGDHLVADIRSYLRENADDVKNSNKNKEVLVSRNGKTYKQDTSNIGKSKQEKEEKQEPLQEQAQPEQDNDDPYDIELKANSVCKLKYKQISVN